MIIKKKQPKENLPKKYENKRERIGKILLQRELLKPEQLQAGLALQKREPGLLGETLVRLGYLREIDIVIALILQCGIPYIAIDEFDLIPEIVHMIPEDVARKNRLIALDRAGQVLSVVMADPVNTKITEQLEKISGYRIVKFVATPSQIEAAINRAYPHDK